MTKGPPIDATSSPTSVADISSFSPAAGTAKSDGRGNRLKVAHEKIRKSRYVPLACTFLVLIISVPSRFLVVRPAIKETVMLRKSEGHQTVIERRSQLSVDGSTRDSAHRYVLLREQEYEEADQLFIWIRRGIGYLYKKHQMILTASFPPIQQAGRNVIRIHNVYDEYEIRSDCHLLTIWVRVLGPEIFAGAATAIQPEDSDETCYWEYSFDLQVPGVYEVDAKVVVWNGFAPTNMTTSEVQCDFYDGKPDADPYPKHNSFIGFKLYGSIQACCELCSREDECRYWATPPYDKKHPSFVTNGCEVFYDANATYPVLFNSTMIAALNAEEGERKRRRLHVLPPSSMPDDNATRVSPRNRRLDGNRHSSPPVVHGPPHSEPTAYYVGCGWSFWFTLDFPCRDGALDDHIHMTNRTFVLTKSTKEPTPLESLTSCNLNEMNFKNGRWVRQEWPDETVCPKAEKDPLIQRFPTYAHDGDRPMCYHRDNLGWARTECVEMNCRFIPQQSLWISSLEMETEFIGVYRNYDCNFLEFTTSQLQQCIDRRKIVPIEVRGASIAQNLREYVDQYTRRNNYTLSNETGTRKVFLDTLASPHIAWHVSEPGWYEQFEKMEPVPDDSEYYIYTPSWWSSEREPNDHIGSAIRLTEVMKEVLQPKGYKILDILEMSAAFTYDTSGQGDGLHLIGPPVKMAVIAMWHDLCSGIVQGTIV